MASKVHLPLRQSMAKEGRGCKTNLVPLALRHRVPAALHLRSGCRGVEVQVIPGDLCRTNFSTMVSRESKGYSIFDHFHRWTQHTAARCARVCIIRMEIPIWKPFQVYKKYIVVHVLYRSSCPLQSKDQSTGGGCCIAVASKKVVNRLIIECH